MRADKRWSRDVQLLASYAYSSNVGDNFSNGFNNDPLHNKGPLDRDFRRILSVSGRFQLGLVLTSVSKPPFPAFLGGLDLNGDGTTGDLLPGTTVNEFNRGLGKEDLRLLVNQFNSIYAGQRDAKGAVIRPVVLPSQFAFGDSFSTQDLRLSREFPIVDRRRRSLIGEARPPFSSSTTPPNETLAKNLASGALRLRQRAACQCRTANGIAAVREHARIFPESPPTVQCGHSRHEKGNNGANLFVFRYRPVISPSLREVFLGGRL